MLNKQQLLLLMVSSNHKKSLCLGIAKRKNKAGGEKAVLTKRASNFLGIILPSKLSSHHYPPGSMKTIECLALEDPSSVNEVKCLLSAMSTVPPWSVQMSHSRSTGTVTLAAHSKSLKTVSTEW